MGKGDKKSRRGKITIGSYGVRRPKKNKKATGSAAPKAAAKTEKKAAPKKAAPRKTAKKEE
jgi:30S ribosomal protein S31